MKKIAVLFIAILITAPIVSTVIPNTNARIITLDDLLGLDRRNAVYMLIRNTTWDIRGAQDMDLPQLCNIRTSAETSIGLMTIIPGPNPFLALRLSFAIFLLARLFSIEDGGDFQHTLDLYHQMIVPTRDGLKTV